MEIVLGSREDQEKRLQECYDIFVKGLEEKLANGSISQTDFDLLEDTYQRGSWEAVRAIFKKDDRPRYIRRNGMSLDDGT